MLPRTIWCKIFGCTFSPGRSYPPRVVEQVCSVHVIDIFGCTFLPGHFLPILHIYPPMVQVTSVSVRMCTCVRDGLQSSCRVHLYFLLLFHPRNRRKPITYQVTKGRYCIELFKYDRMVWKCKVWKGFEPELRGSWANLIWFHFVTFDFCWKLKPPTLARGLGFIPGIVHHRCAMFEQLLFLIFDIWKHCQGCFSVRPPLSSIRLNFFSFFKIPDNFSSVCIVVSTFIGTCQMCIHNTLKLLLLLVLNWWY